jgi:hypothetical protein
LRRCLAGAYPPWPEPVVRRRDELLETEAPKSHEPYRPAEATACEKMITCFQTLTAQSTRAIALQAMLHLPRRGPTATL